MAKASSAEELAAAAQAFNEAQQEGRLMEWFILILLIVLPLLMVGMVVSPWAAPEADKESSAEEPAAAAQAFKEAQRQGRLMKGFIAGRSLVTLIVMAGTFVLPSAAVEMAKESSAAAAAKVFSKVQQQGWVKAYSTGPPAGDSARPFA